MPRYYEAEALIEFVKQYSPSINGETTLECVERAIRNAPTADVVPRSEVERLTIELKAMRGSANSYKMHYEQAQAEKDNLIATYEACMRTYSEQLFEEIENLVAKYIDISIQTKSITSELNFEDMKTDLAELKKKHLGDKK